MPADTYRTTLKIEGAVQRDQSTRPAQPCVYEIAFCAHTGVSTTQTHSNDTHTRTNHERHAHRSRTVFHAERVLHILQASPRLPPLRSRARCGHPVCKLVSSRYRTHNGTLSLMSMLIARPQLRRRRTPLMLFMHEAQVSAVLPSYEHSGDKHVQETQQETHI